MRRRTFWKTAGTAGLAAALARPLWALPPDSRYMKTIGQSMQYLKNL